MAVRRKKAAVVGCGSVGAMAADHMIMAGICDDLILIDKNEQKAWAEAEDLSHALAVTGDSATVRSGAYEDCTDAEVVVITASVPFKPGLTRLDMAEGTAEIMDSIVPGIMKSGFSGKILVVSNPVDVMTEYVWRLSGLPASSVMGTGTSLDSARLRYYLAGRMGLDSQSIQAVCAGEHGQSQVALWSHAFVGGKRITDILADNGERIQGETLKKIAEDTMRSGDRIMEYKRATTFGIAAVIAQIVKAILYDENKIIPVSTKLNRAYGERCLFAGVPAVINRNGVAELIEYHMTGEEREAFERSLDVIERVRDQIIGK